MSSAAQAAKDSAAQKTTDPPNPPPPLIAPTGNADWDTLTSDINQAAAPFQDLSSPDASDLDKANDIIGGIMGAIMTPLNLLNDGFALLTAPIAKLFPPLPAATLGMLHLGIPHEHDHPPAFPIPLPSFGAVALAGSASVLINGIPAARAGDIGIAITCGTFAPPFEVFTGSSKVFIGGARAARMLDITRHCQPGGGWSALAKLAEAGLGLLGVGTEVLGAITQASDAKKDRDKASKAADEKDAAADRAKAAKEKVDKAKAALQKAASGPSDDGGGSSGPSSTPDSIAEIDAQADAADAQMDADDAKAEEEAEAQEKAIEQAEDDLEAAEDEEADAKQDEADAEEQEQEYGDAADAADASAKTSAIQAALDAAAMALGLLMGLDPGLPPCFGLLLTGMPNVLIGGFPMPPWADVAHGLKKLVKLKTKKLKLKSEGERSGHGPNEKCDRPGHPINPVTGANEDELVDYLDPGHDDGSADNPRGRLPFRWSRRYSSADADRDGPMGRGFRHGFQHELAVDLDRVTYTHPEGAVIAIPIPGPRQPATSRRGYVLEVRDEGAKVVYTIARHGDPTLEFVREKTSTAAPRLVAQHARTGRRDFDHDALGRMIGMHETSYRGPIETRLELDPSGHIVAVRRGFAGDARGRSLVAAYQYDRAGNLVAWTDALGAGGSYAYSAPGRIARLTDPNGYSFHYTYDAEGRCVEEHGDDGLYRVALAYDPEARRTVVTRADGGAWTYTYDESLAIVSIEDPYGGRRERIVDDEGRVVRELGAGGQRLDMLYDATGRHLGLTDALGYQVPPRDEEPRPLDPLAHRVPGTAEAREWGELREELAVRSAEVASLPAAARRLLGEVAPDGVAPRTVRDAAGRVVEEVGAGWTRTWTRDPSGNPVRYVDRDGREHRTVVTSWNLVGATIDPLGGTTRFDHTPQAKIRRIVDPGGNESRYEYDKKDRLVRVVRHGETREVYLYDEGDRLIEKRDGEGQPILRRTIGPNGLPSERRLASGEVYRYAYDAGGRVTRASTREVEVVRELDGRGRVVRDTRGGLGVVHRHEGSIVRETTYLDRFTVTYRRAKGGALLVETPAGGVHRIGRCDWGSVVVSLGNGTETAAAYDAGGRCRGRAVWRRREGKLALWSVAYTFSAEGELRRVEDDARGVTEYTYDAAHRIAGERSAGGREASIVLDAAGNVLSKPGLTRGALREGNRLESADGERFGYDARGRLAEHEAAGETARYRYDSMDMLVSISWSGRAGEWTAGYDGLRRRLFKSFAGARTEYFWDGDRLAAEIGPTGAVRVYVYPALEALVPFMFLDYESLDADPESAEPRYVFGNAIGVPLHVEDQDGRTLWLAEHVEPHGAVTVHRGASIAYAPRFPGHHCDDETGLFYNRYRYYSPRLGRYLQPDPIGPSGGINLYAYTANPLAQVDVLGLTTCGGGAEGPPHESVPHDKEKPDPSKPPHEDTSGPGQALDHDESDWLYQVTSEDVMGSIQKDGLKSAFLRTGEVKAAPHGSYAQDLEKRLEKGPALKVDGYTKALVYSGLKKDDIINSKKEYEPFTSHPDYGTFKEAFDAGDTETANQWMSDHQYDPLKQFAGTDDLKLSAPRDLNKKLASQDIAAASKFVKDNPDHYLSKYAKDHTTTSLGVEEAATARHLYFFDGGSPSSTNAGIKQYSGYQGKPVLVRVPKNAVPGLSQDPAEQHGQRTQHPVSPEHVQYMTPDKGTISDPTARGDPANWTPVKDWKRHPG